MRLKQNIVDHHSLSFLVGVNFEDGYDNDVRHSTASQMKSETQNDKFINSNERTSYKNYPRKPYMVYRLRLHDR